MGSRHVDVVPPVFEFALSLVTIAPPVSPPDPDPEAPDLFEAC